MTESVKAVPIKDAYSPTPSDSVDTTWVSRSVFSILGGTIRVTLSGMADGTWVEYTTVDNERQPLGIKRLWLTGTTAIVLLES
jgi:hypothetical protein